MSTASVAMARIYAAEAAVASVRVAVVAFNSLLYAFFLDHAGTRPVLAYSIIGSANLYAVAVYLTQPYRRFPVLLSATFTTIMDAVFISVWLLATGGFHSPFYLLWLLSVTAVAFRFGLRAALVAAGVYSACYAALIAFDGALLPNLVEFALRAGYILLVATLGGLMSREVDTQARAKDEFRAMADELRESKEKVRLLSDVAFEGIAVHENGRVLEANPAFARMFGWAPETIVGLHAAELVDPVSLPMLAERLKNQTDEPYELLGRRRDGSTFHARIVARSVPYNGKTLRVVAVQDVSAQRKGEAAIREREALAIQNDRLREMDAIKSRFINHAAHELGTPLTPIKLQAHLLRVGNLGELNERQKQAVDVLSRNADQLGAMVRSLLDASRVRSQPAETRRERFDVGRLVEELLPAWEAGTSGGPRVSWTTERGLHIGGDRPRLTQVLMTIVSNARRFTPAEGRIEVQARREGDRVILSVRDTGAGIDASDLPKLFEPFSQLHDTMQESRSGAGLSLYVARGIVESHGGRIWAQSGGRGKGTTFFVSLPAA